MGVEPSRPLTLSRQGLDVARACGDVEALAQCVPVVHQQMPRAERDVRHALAVELERAAVAAGSVRGLLSAYQCQVYDHLERGDLAGFERVRQAHGRRCSGASSADRRHASYWDVVAFVLAGRFAEADAVVGERWGEAARSGSVVNRLHALYQLFWLRREQGRVDEVEEALRRFGREFPQYPRVGSLLGRLLIDVGRPEEAARDWTDHRSGEPMPGELCAALGDGAGVESAYERLLPLAGCCRVWPPFPLVCEGAWDEVLGLLAATVQRWDDAEQHLADALALHDRMGSAPLAARTRRALAALAARPSTALPGTTTR